MKFLVLLLIFGCASIRTPVEIPKVPEVANPTPNPGHVGEAVEYVEPVRPIESVEKIFTTHIETENCSEAHKAKVREAETLIRKIFNSQEFKEEILSFQFQGKTQFNWPNDLSNSEIYKHIFGGAEALRPALNYQMDITIVCYTDKWSKTVGYTYPKENKVWANMKYHASYSAVDVASNSAHEWLHKMGFGHAVKWSKERDFTVPYGMNSIVKKLGPLAKEDKLSPIKEM